MRPISPLVKGIITGTIMVVATLAVYKADLPPESSLHYGLRILFAGGIFWTLISYARSPQAERRFSVLFGQGFRCFIVATLIMVAFTAIFNMMHPEFAEVPAEAYRQELIKEGNKNIVEIDKMVADAKKRHTTAIVYFTIFGYLLTGALVTAAGSAILMRRN